MCAKLLNTEEIAKLKLHPYVVDATEQFIYFTVKFKKRFYTEYLKGKKPKRIITEMGIDPELKGRHELTASSCMC